MCSSDLVNLSDLTERPLRALADDEVLDVGRHRLRWLDTPHVPGPWEAGVLIEETTGTMFCGDLLAQAGQSPPSTDGDVVGPAIDHEQHVHGTARTPDTEPTLRRLAGRRPARLALMHGPVFTADAAAALEAYADWLAYAESTAGPLTREREKALH